MTTQTLAMALPDEFAEMNPNELMQQGGKDKEMTRAGSITGVAGIGAIVAGGLWKQILNVKDDPFSDLTLGQKIQSGISTGLMVAGTIAVLTGTAIAFVGQCKSS